MKFWNHRPAISSLLLALLGLLLSLAASAFGATDTPFSVSLGFDFASGDYGSSQTTDSYSIPLTIGYYPNTRLDFSLEIPYLYQSSSSTVVLGGNRFPRQNPGATTAGGMAAASAASSRTSAQNGPGDINLTAGYVLLADTATTPMLRPLFYIKAPTANKDKGLGTGAFDFGGGLSSGMSFGPWSAYVEALYVTPGATSTYKPDNYLSYQAALRYRLNHYWNAGLSATGATAAFDGYSDALEVQLTSSYRVSQQGRLGAYLGKGLSDSSPDYTGGFYAMISF